MRDHDFQPLLESLLAERAGKAMRIARLDRRPSEYSTSFTLEELDVTLDGGEVLQLIFKDLGPRSLLAEAARVRPEFLYSARREIDVYTNLLAPCSMGTAECHASLIDPANDRYWLFLERVPSAKLCHVGDLEIWKDTARWLAEFHCFAQDHSPTPSAPLLHYDAAYFSRWMKRLTSVVHSRTPTNALNALLIEYGRSAHRLAAAPRTTLHGEFYASNILIRDQSRDGHRICPVDWELASRGPALIDLAALSAGKWSDHERLQIVNAYRDAIASTGAGLSTLAAFDEMLDHARLHLAVQWATWSADWNAPPDQSQDWLDEAIELAGRLSRS